MTASTMARCDFCGTDVPAGEVFEPYSGAVRCRDVAACERRQLRRFDPTVLRDEDHPVPPAASTPPGAVCDACRTVTPAGLYKRMPGAWFCRDRGACEAASVETTYLTAWSDSSPDRLISSADMRAMTAAARPEVPPDPAPLDPARAAALAAQDALGRKR